MDRDRPGVVVHPVNARAGKGKRSAGPVAMAAPGATDRQTLSERSSSGPGTAEPGVAKDARPVPEAD